MSTSSVSAAELRMRWAPVERGLAMRPVRGEEFALHAPLHGGVRDDAGRITPVLVAMLADSGIGFTIVTAARLHAGAPTVDLRIDHLGPAAPGAIGIRADYTVLHLDDHVGVGRADLRDDTGRPLAHAVATVTITGVPDRPGGLSGDADRIPPGADFREGRAPFDPARLAPENLETDGPDGPDAVLVPGLSATNFNGTTHGAVLVGFARAAQARFLGVGARPLSDTVDYLRPVPLDARLRARTEQVRSGRRFWSLRTEILLPDDRVAARAVGNGLWETEDRSRTC